MSGLSDILNQLPISQIAEKVGISEKDAASGINKIIPGLLGGMKSNAESGGADSLIGALTDHGKRDVKSVKDIDTADGKKIVGHILGTDEKAAANKVGAKDDGESNLIGQLLPVVAPFLLSIVGQKLTGGSKGGVGDAVGGLLGGGGIGDLLGGLLGGEQSSSSKSKKDDGGLGGIVGGIGDALGGLFGGKK